MKEIEVKAKIDNFELILEKLNNLGCTLSEPLTQKDMIFLPSDIPFSEIRNRAIKQGVNVIRIRNQNGKLILTLKQPQANELDCIEKETVIEDANQMQDMLRLLNYVEVVKINKVRRKCKYQNYEICLDEVENLGNFIKIEKISDEDALKVQEELFQILMQLGVPKENRVLNGYDTLIFNQRKKVVIGSSMKFRSIVKDTMAKLSNLNLNPLFPNIDYSEENRDVAKSEEEKSKLAWDHYKAIEEADAVYFILPNGYMGTSCKMELGYALALGKPVYFSELTNDMGIDCYHKKVIPLENLELFKSELK